MQQPMAGTPQVARQTAKLQERDQILVPKELLLRKNASAATTLNIDKV
jgi:hypothetical protein